MTQSNIDIIVMSETKIDDSFSTQQFIIEGYARPYWRDRNKEGGGMILGQNNYMLSISLWTLISREYFFRSISGNVNGPFRRV